MTEPDWSLLPHDPEKFFGLGEFYDRRDLKRAYNQLLKQFKPEKHPEEFQRLRSAYEALEQQLRYAAGGSPLSMPISTAGWDVQPGATPADAGASSGRPRPASALPEPVQPRVIPWHTRVQSESVETLAAELREQTDKSAYDYYCLALMADALPDAEPLAMVRWLLAGLKEHPQDPALFAMLAQALRNPLPAKLLATVLPAVAKVVRDDRFYFLTEPLWDQLLARGDFGDFARLLQGCESQLRDHRIAGKLTFYLHILRPALWRADDQWIEQAVELLDSHSSELGKQFELELEIFSQLRAYRDIRDDFLDGDPVRAALDSVIQDYCLLKDFEAEQSFLRFQVLLGSGDLDVLSAFEPEADAVCMAVYQTWNWIELDMAMRFGVDFNTDDSDEGVRQLRKSVRTLLRGLEARGRSMFSGQAAAWVVTAYQTTRWFSYPIIFCLLMLGPWLFAPKMQGEVWVLLTIGMVVVSFFLGRLFSAKLLLPFWQMMYRRLLNACYRRLWRGELLQFIRDRYLSYDALRATLIDMQGDGLNCTNALLAFAMGDVSLAMGASALRFLT